MRLLLAVVLVALVALPVAAQDAGDDQALELADEPAGEPEGLADDLADEPATEPAGVIPLAEASEPATVAVELPSGQTAEIVLTATLGEMALLAVALFAVAWRVATWAWWLLTELLS